MEERQPTKTHKLIINNRRTGTISGINDVISFDISEVLLETDIGMLLVKGNDLHVSRLSIEKGEVDIDGKIDSITYSEVSNYAKQGESFFGRLFK